MEVGTEKSLRVRKWLSEKYIGKGFLQNDLHHFLRWLGLENEQWRMTNVLRIERGLGKAVAAIKLEVE